MLLLSPFSGHCPPISPSWSNGRSWGCAAFSGLEKQRQRREAKPRVRIWWPVKWGENRGGGWVAQTGEVGLALVRSRRQEVSPDENALWSVGFAWERELLVQGAPGPAQLQMKKLQFTRWVCGSWRSRERSWWSLERFGWPAAPCPLQASRSCSPGCVCPAWGLHQRPQAFTFRVSLSWVEPPPFRFVMVNSIRKSKGGKNWVKLFSVCLPDLLAWFIQVRLIPAREVPHSPKSKVELQQLNS